MLPVDVTVIAAFVHDAAYSPAMRDMTGVNALEPTIDSSPAAHSTSELLATAVSGTRFTATSTPASRVPTAAVTHGHRERRTSRSFLMRFLPRGPSTPFESVPVWLAGGSHSTTTTTSLGRDVVSAGVRDSVSVEKNSRLDTTAARTSSLRASEIGRSRSACHGR